MKLRRYWLDVDFPQHAPPEFERSGYVLFFFLKMQRAHISTIIALKLGMTISPGGHNLSTPSLCSDFAKRYGQWH